MLCYFFFTYLKKYQKKKSPTKSTTEDMSIIPIWHGGFMQRGEQERQALYLQRGGAVSSKPSCQHNPETVVNNHQGANCRQSSYSPLCQLQLRVTPKWVPTLFKWEATGKWTSWNSMVALCKLQHEENEPLITNWNSMLHPAITNVSVFKNLLR